MAYSIKTKEFEGPLELLLDLIEARKLSINEVSLSEVAQEYFHYLKIIKERDSATYHQDIASFLVIATTLMLIKSRSLLSGFYISQEEETDIQELERRLETYRLVKLMAVDLGKIVNARTPIYERQALFDAAPAFLPPPISIELDQLLGFLKTLIRAIPKKPELPQKIIKKIVSLEEKIKELEKRIEEGLIKTFKDFVHRGSDKLDIVVSFLAMLQLIKIGVLVAEQTNLFDSIYLSHGTRKNS